MRTPFSRFLPVVLLLGLSACSFGGGQDGAVSETASPVAGLQDQIASPAPRQEPPFRANIVLNADRTTLRVGETTRVSVRLTGLQQAPTTFSSTWTVSGGARFAAVTPDEKALPLSFKSGVAPDGKSASLAASNAEGISGETATVASLTVEAVAPGKSVIALDGNDTAVLLSDNADVAPQQADLPKLEITVE